MRKVLIFSLFGLFILPLTGFTQGQDVKVTPLVLSQEGSGSASFFEMRWPDFYEFIPAGGCSILDSYSKKRKIKDGQVHDIYPQPEVPGLQPDINGDGIFDRYNDLDASGQPVYE